MLVGIGLTSALILLRAGAGAKGLSLKAEPLVQSATLSLDPLADSFASWAAEPAGADKIGRLAYGSIRQRLAPVAFGDVFTFTRASVAQDFGRNRDLKEAAVNALRGGFSPVDGAPLGWLLEPAATNLLTYSTDFSNAAFALSGLAVAGSVIGPLGDPAYEIVEDTALAAAHLVSRVVSGLATGTVYTHSIIAKERANNAGKRYLGVYIAAGSAYSNSRGAVFDLATGAVVYNTVSPVTPAAEHLGNGWWRCSITLPPTDAAGSASWRMRSVNDLAAGITGTHDGDGVSGFLLAGAQFEANPAPSSFLKTGAATVTRADDNLTIAGDAFAHIFGVGATLGAIWLDFLVSDMPPAGSPYIPLDLTDGTSANQLTLRNASAGGTNILAQPKAGGATGSPTSGNPGGFTPGTVQRIGLRWSGGGTPNGAYSVCLDGGSIVSNTGALPAFTMLHVGRTKNNSVRAFSGRVRGLYVAPRSVSDAKFQAASVPGADIDAILMGA